MAKVLKQTEQEIKSYSGADYFNFWTYGHELRERQRDGWYIKNLVDMGEGQCSILWEKYQESDPT